MSQPSLTSACKRPPIASARTSLRPLAAPDAGRWVAAAQPCCLAWPREKQTRRDRRRPPAPGPLEPRRHTRPSQAQRQARPQAAVVRLPRPTGRPGRTGGWAVRTRRRTGPVWRPQTPAAGWWVSGPRRRRRPRLRAGVVFPAPGARARGGRGARHPVPEEGRVFWCAWGRSSVAGRRGRRRCQALAGAGAAAPRLGTGVVFPAPGARARGGRGARHPVPEEGRRVLACVGAVVCGRVSRSETVSVPCPRSAWQAPGGCTLLGGRPGPGGAERLVPGVCRRGSRRLPRPTGRCTRGWRRSVRGKVGHPRRAPATQQTLAGDGPQRASSGRRGVVPVARA